MINLKSRYNGLDSFQYYFLHMLFKQEIKNNNHKEKQVYYGLKNSKICIALKLQKNRNMAL